MAEAKSDEKVAHDGNAAVASNDGSNGTHSYSRGGNWGDTGAYNSSWGGAWSSRSYHDGGNDNSNWGAAETKS